MEYRLINVITNNYCFKNKLDAKTNFKLMPSFGKGIAKINDSIYELHLSFSLHDRGEDISPYDLDLEIKGIFEFKNGVEDEIMGFMDNNAVAITFPYLRTIISTTMTAMNLPPIFLPIVDAKEIFKKENISA